MVIRKNGRESGRIQQSDLVQDEDAAGHNRTCFVEAERLEDCLQRLCRAEDELVTARRSLAQACSEQGFHRNVSDQVHDVSKSRPDPLPPQKDEVRIQKADKSDVQLSPRWQAHQQTGSYTRRMSPTHFLGTNSIDSAARNFLPGQYRASQALERPHAIKGYARGTTATMLMTDEEHTPAEATAFECHRVCGGIPLLIIHPEARLRLFWIGPAFAFILMEAFLVPFILAFDVRPSHSSPLGVLLRCVDLYFVADVILTCLTGYRDQHGGLVMKPWKIAVHYARGWFLVDSLAAIPWSFIANTSYIQAVTRGLKVLRMLRMLRLLRLAKLRQLIEAVETLMEAYQGAEVIMGFMKVLLLLGGVTHWGACLWYSVGSEESGWIQAAMRFYNIDPSSDVSIETKYVWSLYFTLTTLTTVGYGDISPATTRECQYVLILLLTSAIVFSGLLGMLSDLIASVNKETRIMAHKKRLLARYMRWRSVPRHLMMKVRKHLLFVWGMQKDYDLYEDELKRILTPTLKTELSYHVFKEVLRSAPFLGWMRGHTAGFKLLANSVRSSFFDCTDFIFRTGDECKEIYVLLGGIVVLKRRASDEHDEDSDETHLPEKERVDRAWAAWDAVKSVNQLNRQTRISRLRNTFTQKMRMGKELLFTGTISDESEPPDQLFRGPCFSEALHRASFAIVKDDVIKRQAARHIQGFWRRRKQAMISALGNQELPLTGVQVAAPAYFGESCLWDPFHEWRTRSHYHTYTVHCKTRTEVVSIPRIAIANCIQRYSPWLRDRFEMFRLVVMQNQEFEVPANDGLRNLPGRQPVSVADESTKTQI